jgi:hypothetical protein
MSKKAVVLYSGGLDSTTCLAEARAAGFEPYALSFHYGQRHTVELEKARLYAPRIGAVDHMVIDFDLRRIGGSALTSDQEVPKGREIDDAIPASSSASTPSITRAIPTVDRNSSAPLSNWPISRPGPASRGRGPTASTRRCCT